MASILLWRDIYQIADKVALEFNLPYGTIVPETRKKAWWFGEAFSCEKCRRKGIEYEASCKSKIIYIRTHCLNKPHKPLSPSTILRTLAHELAHIREWTHGPQHTKLEKEIVLFIKQLGYEV